MTTLLLIGDVLTVQRYWPRSDHVTCLSDQPRDLSDLQVPLSLVLSDDAKSLVIDHCLKVKGQRHRITVQPRHLVSVQYNNNVRTWLPISVLYKSHTVRALMQLVRHAAHVWNVQLGAPVRGL